MSADNEEWESKDLVRKAYYVEGDDLNDGQVEVIVRVKGKLFAQLSFGEPGLVAIVSRPNENGIHIESVRPGGVRYTDVKTPNAVTDQQILPWQKEALGVK